MKEKIKNEFKLFFNIVKEYKIESCIIAVVGLICLIGFEYIDGVSFMAYSIEIWDALFSGRILELPQVLIENMRQAPHAGLNMGGGALIFLPWSIWNFPIWLTHTFPKISDVLTPLCLMWTKLFLYIGAILVGMQCYHIVKLLTNNEKNGKLAAILVWGARTVWICTGYSMQDEMQYIFTILLALRYYFHGKNKQCILWLTITTFFAPFMMLLGLIIILFMEKRIWRIIVDCFIIILPYTIISKSMPIIWESHDNYLDWFLNRTVIQTGISQISIYLIALVIIYVIAYFINYRTQEEKNDALLYFLAIASTLMCTLSWVHFYRYVTCLPFLVIAALSKKNRHKSQINGFVIMLTIFEMSRLLGAIFFDQNFLAPRYTSRLVNKFIDNDIPSIVELLSRTLESGNDMVSIVQMLLGSLIFVVGFILLWFIKNKYENVTQIVENHKILTKIYVSIPMIVFCVFFLIISRIDITSNEIYGNSMLAQPITNDTIFETSYYSNSNRMLSLSIRPVTWGRTYPEDLKLCMDIVDNSSGNVINDYEVKANDLQDNTEYIFYTSDARLEKNKDYTIKLYIEGTIEDENDYIYLLRTDENCFNKNTSMVINNILNKTKQSMNYSVISNIITIK